MDEIKLFLSVYITEFYESMVITQLSLGKSVYHSYLTKKLELFAYVLLI